MEQEWSGSLFLSGPGHPAGLLSLELMSPGQKVHGLDSGLQACINADDCPVASVLVAGCSHNWPSAKTREREGGSMFITSNLLATLRLHPAQMLPQSGPAHKTSTSSAQVAYIHMHVSNAEANDDPSEPRCPNPGVGPCPCQAANRPRPGLAHPPSACFLPSCSRQDYVP